MRKTHKILGTLLSAMLITFCAFSFTGCSDSNALTVEKVISQLQEAGFTEVHIKESEETEETEESSGEAYATVFVDNNEETEIVVPIKSGVNGAHYDIYMWFTADSDVEGILDALVVNFDDSPNAGHNLLVKIQNEIDKSLKENGIGVAMFSNNDKGYICSSGLDKTKTYMSLIHLSKI